ncbi:MAG TPA: helix-turn-helix domain-containing protein [Pseudonocardia sp.]|nr:helix-turn-helix domain-containing protein [Pseudonocardia sp.]
MGTDLQDIVDEVSRVLATPVVLEDRDFNLVAFAAHADEVDPVRQRTIFQRRSSPEVQDWFESFGIAGSDRPVRTPADPARGIVARACLPARWNGVTYGYLWALDEHHRIDDALLARMMRQAARAGTLMAQRARIRQSLDGQVRDLLTGDRDIAEAAAEEIDGLGALGRDATVLAVVLDLDAPGDPPPLNLWRLPRAVVAVATGTDVVLLVPATLDAHGIARDARLLFTERLHPGLHDGVVAGVGATRPDLALISGSVREARIAARVAHAVPRLRPVATWADLGVHRLLACGPRRALREGVVDPAVEPLLARPDLAATAAAYLDHAGNVQRAAAELGVHRQTLYYRLQRIEALTGLDLADGRDRLRLHLALTLAPLVG